MCVVCSSGENAYRSIRATNIVEMFELDSPRAARRHLESGERHGVFSRTDVAILGPHLCDIHHARYRANLSIVEDLAAQPDDLDIVERKSFTISLGKKSKGARREYRTYETVTYRNGHTSTIVKGK